MWLVAVIACSLVVLVVWLIARRQNRLSVEDSTGMVGRVGEALETFAEEGKVFIRGECWRATAVKGIVQKGERVRVREVRSGLLLVVERFK